MTDTLISALVQAPFVLVMAYLVQRFLAHLAARDNEWRHFIERAEQARAAQMQDLTEAVHGLSALIIEHDASVRALEHLKRDRHEGTARPARRER